MVRVPRSRRPGASYLLLGGPLRGGKLAPVVTCNVATDRHVADEHEDQEVAPRRPKPALGQLGAVDRLPEHQTVEERGPLHRT